MSNVTQSIEDIVKELVSAKILRSELFTALDISNEIKESLKNDSRFPNVRHRDISPIVRTMFNNFEMADYSCTAVQVTLANGDTSEANLYHAVEDTWDLDTKYDNSKRAQKAKPPVQVTDVGDHNPIDLLKNSIQIIKDEVKVTAPEVIVSAPSVIVQDCSLFANPVHIKPDPFSRKSNFEILSEKDVALLSGQPVAIKPLINVEIEESDDSFKNIKKKVATFGIKILDRLLGSK